MIDENFIDEWIKYQDADDDDPDELHWTDSYLFDLGISEYQEELWNFVVSVYRRPMEEHTLAVLAAGPLEDLLTKSGDIYIDKIEILARRDPLFAKLLAGVWQSSMSDELWARVCAVKGEPW